MDIHIIHIEILNMLFGTPFHKNVLSLPNINFGIFCDERKKIKNDLRQRPETKQRWIIDNCAGFIFIYQKKWGKKIFFIWKS